jgi:hypothetical protein
MMKIWFNNMIQKKSQKGKSAYAISKELKPQEIKLVPIEMVAQKDATLPLYYLNEEKNYITSDYLDYIEPLVGELPVFAKFDFLG